ncbi:hypothetical protein TrST_g9153 [Triparma strigata]|uniref:Peptidyl-prolyl cis-trans isomerase n=1 Tax=Triparma strigata TaxID=1606541 RepID=A0A9W7C883_9STRA|nr:hypothetical protein TrST_g9153 [Triparma strigata]
MVASLPALASFFVVLFCVLLMTMLPDSCALTAPAPTLNATTTCATCAFLCDNQRQAQQDLPEDAPDFYQAVFETDAPGCFVLNVTRSWAPLGADQFYTLLKDEFYTVGGGAAFFRVVPDFVVQWGISGSPDETQKWDAPIQDDPVIESNVAWTVSYATAGPNTRTSQIFINLIDNSRLDASGFAPFATVVEGMDIVNNLINPTPGDSNGVDQDLYTEKGDEYIEANYAGKINKVVNVSIIV